MSLIRAQVALAFALRAFALRLRHSVCAAIAASRSSGGSRSQANAFAVRIADSQKGTLGSACSPVASVTVQALRPHGAMPLFPPCVPRHQRVRMVERGVALLAQTLGVRDDVIVRLGAL